MELTVQNVSRELSSTGMSQATALGLLLLERSRAPLAGLSATWWDLLRPQSRTPFRLEEAPDQLLAAVQQFTGSGLGLAGFGPGGPGECLAVAEAEAFVRGVWEASRQRLREVEAEADKRSVGGSASAEYWTPRSPEAAAGLLERLRAVEAEAELRLQALEVALAGVERQERWGLFERQLLAAQDDLSRGAEEVVTTWPELGPLGEGFALWCWSLGLVQLNSQAPYHPLRPRHVPLLVEELLGSSLEVRCLLAVVERSTARGCRVGSYGLKWLMDSLYGPSGLWAPFPSQREPLFQRLGSAVALAQQLMTNPAVFLEQRVLAVTGGRRSGSVEESIAGSPWSFGLSDDHEVQLFPEPALNALAVGAAAVLHRAEVLVAKGYELLPSWAGAREQVLAFPASQAEALRVESERLDRIRRFRLGDVIGETTAELFQVPVTRELICSVTALFLRHGKALVEGRFAREPGLLRQEFSAFCAYRLAQWDGQAASALQEALEPLPAPLARALRPETLRQVSRAWQGPLGLPAAGQWGPEGWLPALSPAQWLDWRVREVLVPLARAVLAELYGQLLVATGQRREELQALVVGEAEQRVVEARQELQLQEQLREGLADVVTLARSQGQVKAWGLEKEAEALELDFSDYAQAVLSKSEEERQEGVTKELSLLTLLGELAPSQQLQLQAPWLEEVLPASGSVRLRPFLMESGVLLARKELELRLAGVEESSAPTINGYQLQGLELLAERLHVEPELLAAWLRAQPFSLKDCLSLARMLKTKQVTEPGRFGGLTETLLAANHLPGHVAPRWLQQRLYEAF